MPRSRRPWHTVRAFTLVELLVTITIIGLLAGITLGAIQAARQTAREANTKALIAKLNHVIMQRYDSYQTRRVPISSSGLPPKPAAEFRLAALRDLIRMEMPERCNDILLPPTKFDFDAMSWPVGQRPTVQPWPGDPDSVKLMFPDGRIKCVPVRLPPPAISYRYKQQVEAAKAKYPDEVVGEFAPAECLYMIVSFGSADAMENFSPSEIGDADGDGLPEFHDAWGRPIMFLRWAPGFTDVSEIQKVENHDPFDTRQVDPDAIDLIPLIYSGGRDKQYDLDPSQDYAFDGDPMATNASPFPGTPVDEDGDGLNYHDNIHNHAISQE